MCAGSPIVAGVARDLRGAPAPAAGAAAAVVAAAAAAAVGEGTCSGGGRCASNLGAVLPRTMTSVRHRSGSPHWGSLTGSRSCCSSCCRMS